MQNGDNPYGGSYGNATVGSVNFGDQSGDGAVTGGALIKETTTADFTNDVIAESRNQPVLVDFWAPWCGPCKTIAPALEEIASEMGGRVQIAKVNIDENPQTPQKYGVRGIPTLMLFKDGQVAATKVGALPKSQLSEWVESVI